MRPANLGYHLVLNLDNKMLTISDGMKKKAQRTHGKQEYRCAT